MPKNPYQPPKAEREPPAAQSIDGAEWILAGAIAAGLVVLVVCHSIGL